MNTINTEVLSIDTTKREELIDITPELRKIVRRMNIKNGLAVVFVLHTTAGVFINETADPSVRQDILTFLSKTVPRDPGYLHMEGNSDAHIKASMFGCSQIILINDGEILLGTWQGVFLAEFDGPRRRKVYVKSGEGVLTYGEGRQGDCTKK